MINAPYRKAKSPVNRHYIDQETLKNEVQNCIDNNRTCSDLLGKYFYEIIDHMINSVNFYNYSAVWKDQMREYAIYKLMRSMKTVDLAKCKNVFNYYSRTVYLAFLTQLVKLRRNAERVNKYKDKLLKNKGTK